MSLYDEIGSYIVFWQFILACLINSLKSEREYATRYIMAWIGDGWGRRERERERERERVGGERGEGRGRREMGERGLEGGPEGRISVEN